MIESEHHQGVGVGENAFIDRQFVAGLVDALEDRNRMAGRFTGDLLETEGRAVEQFECSRYALKELRSAPFRRLVGRPGDAANFRHGRKPIVELLKVALGLPRIAPCPVDAHAPRARRIFARNVIRCRCGRISACSSLFVLYSFRIEARRSRAVALANRLLG